MITRGWVQIQVQESIRARSTTGALRQLILHVVHRALVAHYGVNYAIRCLQACCGVQLLLTKLDLQSTIWEGALCCAHGCSARPDIVSWGGFWDRDHHYWLATQFYEIVDLTIRHSHKHPARSRDDGFQVPAFWWNVEEGLPPTIFYLPEGVVADDAPFENQDDAADMTRFLQVVDDTWEERLRSLKPQQVSFGPLLTGYESWARLAKAGHSWVLVNCRAAEINLPLPPWVAKRLQALSYQNASGGDGTGSDV